MDARWRGKNQQSVYPYDSALLRSSYNAPGVQATATTRPAVGERVSVWGFALTTIMFESGGSVESISDEWIRYLPGIGMPQVKGHSGSPMLDANKTVIGIEAGGSVQWGDGASLSRYGRRRVDARENHRHYARSLA